MPSPSERSGALGTAFSRAFEGSWRRIWVLPPSNVLITASHCHGIVRGDTAAARGAGGEGGVQYLVPVKVGAGVGHEDRISENRRLKMKDGSEVDMRRAYSMPRDEDVAGVGPIDPQIGLLRLDREDGKPLAVLYNFACHPIMNPPSKGSSADYPGLCLEGDRGIARATAPWRSSCRAAPVISIRCATRR